jgi:RNA polymerase sigma factor (sigma-70 family)
MATDPRTDYELLASWRRGDLEAAAVLAERHVRTLYRFFHNKVHDAMEDLAQKTLLACVEGRDRIDETRSFRAYLLGIARHQLYRHYRGLRRSEREIGALSVAQLVGSPSHEIAVEEERRLLLAALRRLPIETQLVLELFYWEGMTTPEIAATLDEPDGTIRSRLSRGKALLRDVLEEMDAAPEARTATLTRLEDWARGLHELAIR